jgi:mono/diheme cytochrome c family protein
MAAVVRLMTCAGILAWLALVATAGSAHVQAADAQQPASASSPAAASPQRALLNQYCVGCHNQRQKAIGATPLALDSLDVSNIGAGAEQWEKVVLKLRAGLMPPSGMPRPSIST